MPHYKLVKRTEAGLVSVAAFGVAEVVYHENKPTVTHPWLAETGHHLLVFDSIEHVKDFIITGILSIEIHRYEVWECECQDQVNLPEIKNLAYLSTSIIRKSFSLSWPPGTQMFKTVTLTKKVINALL